MLGRAIALSHTGSDANESTSALPNGVSFVRGIRGEPRLGDRPHGAPCRAKRSPGDPGARRATRRGRRRPRGRPQSFSRARRPAGTPFRSPRASGSRRREATRTVQAARRSVRWQHPTDQRNRRRRTPASSGVKAPLAREDRRLVRVCPCVVTVAEVHERRSGLKRRASLWRGSAQTEAQPRRRSRKGAPSGRKKRRGTCGSGRKPLSTKKVRAGRSNRATRGEGPRQDGRHFGSSNSASVHADAPEATSAKSAEILGRESQGSIIGVATGVSEARSARALTGRQRPCRVKRKRRAARQSEIALS